MFAAFFDHRLTIYLLLAVAVVVTGAVWARSNDERAGKGLAAAAVLLLLFFLVDFFVRGETDREQIVRKTEAMADAVAARDVNQIYAHISDRFRLGPVDKPTFRKFADAHVGELTFVKVRNVQPVVFRPAQGDGPATAEMRFIGFVRGDSGDFAGANGYEVVAQYVLDPDSQWRLQTFDLYEKGQRVPIPYLPGP